MGWRGMGKVSIGHSPRRTHESNSRPCAACGAQVNIHIYTAPMQPATDWTDNNSDQPIHRGYAPDAMIYTDCCNKRRAAADCVVHCFYDGRLIFCAPDKGCHDPAVVAANKARQFARRSAGQKARWAKVRANGAAP